MKKDIVVVCVIIFILAVVISGTKIQSVDDYYLTHIDEITEDSETVFLTIECKTILDNMDKLDPALKDEKYVPADGVILKRTEYVLRKGDTVFSILDRAVRHNKIHMECIYTEQFGSIYVQGINQLYEFSCGELSGWIYKVNDYIPNYGCSKYVLKDKDEIVWCYTCDLGQDVGWEMPIEQIPADISSVGLVGEPLSFAILIKNTVFPADLTKERAYFSWRRFE